MEEMLLAPFLKSKMASLAVRYYRRWIFAQQKLERFFSGPISFPDRLKIILRIFDSTGSTGPVTSHRHGFGGFARFFTTTEKSSYPNIKIIIVQKCRLRWKNCDKLIAANVGF